MFAEATLAINDLGKEIISVDLETGGYQEFVMVGGKPEVCFCAGSKVRGWRGHEAVFVGNKGYWRK